MEHTRKSRKTGVSAETDMPKVSYVEQGSEEDVASDHVVVERVYPDDGEYSPAAQVSKELSTLASSGNGVSRISVPREVNRQRVTTAFHDAFELIGGVPRLAHWADSHPTDFFKLYARVLPSEAQAHGAESEDYKVIHSFPKSALDV